MSATATKCTERECYVVMNDNARFWNGYYGPDGPPVYWVEDIRDASLIEKSDVDDGILKTPTDLTWKSTDNRFNPQYEELKKGRLVKLTIATIYKLDLPSFAGVEAGIIKNI